MHPIDEAILRGTLTSTLLAKHAALPPPAPGTSYWGDELHAGRDPVTAAKRAARLMGATVASTLAILRRDK